MVDHTFGGHTAYSRFYIRKLVPNEPEEGVFAKIKDAQGELIEVQVDTSAVE